MTNAEHITRIEEKEGAFVVACSCGEVIEGVYYTHHKASNAAQAHKRLHTPVQSLSEAIAKVADIARKSKTLEEFQRTVRANTFLKDNYPRMVVEALIQEDETGWMLD